jgi:hypothetical protein
MPYGSGYAKAKSSCSSGSTTLPKSIADKKKLAHLRMNIKK